MKRLASYIKKLSNKMRFGIHPAFFVVLLYALVFGGIRQLLIITGLALVHECGHAVVAARRGYQLKKIRLMPFGAELSGEDLFLPKDEVRIALAGPLVNFMICVIMVSCMWVFPGWYRWWQEVFFLSLSLGVFNLLPFFPLDGGRVFVGLASRIAPRKTCLRVARGLTMTFGLFLIGLFIASVFLSFNVSLGIMGVALVISSLVPIEGSAYQRVNSAAYKRKKVQSGLAMRQVVVNQGVQLLTLQQKVDARSFTEFVVVDDEFQEVCRLNEVELDEWLLRFGSGKKLNEIVGKNY